VALKVLAVHGSGVADEQFHKRFFLEAKACARLKHPNTITIHDYGCTEDGTYYIAMELLEGKTLLGLIRNEGDLHEPTAIDIAMQVCRSLAEAHDQGLVHRDLKPSNVFITERDDNPYFVTVLDFGLVKLPGSDDQSITRSGTLLGSPKYMSPEQVVGVQVDHMSDIYSFGVLLFYMLAGKPPFEGNSDFETMRSHVIEPAPRVNEFREKAPISEALEQLVGRCLEKSRLDRFPSMKAVADALMACRGEEASAVRPTSVRSEQQRETGQPRTDRISLTLLETPASKRSESRPKRRPAAALIAAVLLAAGAITWAVWPAEPGTPEGRPGPDLVPSSEEPATVADLPRAPSAGEPSTHPGETRTTVRSDPTGAEVWRDEEMLGTTPLEVDVPAEGSRVFDLRLPGHAPERLEIVDGLPPAVIGLTALAPGPASATTPPGRRPANSPNSPSRMRRPGVDMAGESEPEGPRWPTTTSDNRDPWAQ